MGEMLVACLQDPRESHEYRGMSYREICQALVNGAAQTGGGATMRELFQRLRDYDIGAFALFHNTDFAEMPDGRHALTAVGECLGTAVPEGTICILDDSRPIYPGDLCALSYRCGLTRQAKQYLGRWNGDYDFLVPNRPKIPGHLFYSSNPRCFVIVYGNDLTAATRLGSIITPDGTETRLTPWSIVDDRDDEEFADVFSWAEVDRQEHLVATPLSSWPAIREENRLLVAEWLESRMTPEEREEFIRVNRHLLPADAA